MSIKPTAGPRRHCMWPPGDLWSVLDFLWKQEQTLMFDKRTNKFRFIVQASRSEVISDEKLLL